jgi:hypothetical protein
MMTNLCAESMSKVLSDEKSELDLEHSNRLDA